MKNTKVIAAILSALSILVCLSGSTAYAQLQSGELDLSQLDNYANQQVPKYINGTNEKPKDNTGDNPITDEGATLGRVLFYDKKLSVNNKVSCASCHRQEHAFSDPEKKSQGVAGLTQRHSMRLINTRFAEETRFRWDEAAETLEEQMTIPIRNNVEMGYSGTNGNPDFDDLIEKLKGVDYYPPLFKLVFGYPEITEERMQLALAQFVRSIQSFDTKYDAGLARSKNLMDDFPNFTAAENAGKRLFTEDFKFKVGVVEFKRFRGTTKTSVARRISGGLNCATCHRPPEFDIDPDSLNNGFDRGTRRQRDFSVTRSPTLRDLINPNGELNTPMFHGGTANNIIGIKAHYNFKELNPQNTRMDKRMKPRGRPQLLEITNREQQQLFAFLRTLTGSDVYKNKKWSNPFDGKGKLVLKHPDGSR